ncbi:MAG: hypothetical protein RR912_03720 [Clostridium sp.]
MSSPVNSTVTLALPTPIPSTTPLFTVITLGLSTVYVIVVL